MNIKYKLHTVKIYGVSIVGEDGSVIRAALFWGKTRDEVEDFIKLCNEEHLEPIHLKDAISDMMYK